MNNFFRAISGIAAICVLMSLLFACKPKIIYVSSSGGGDFVEHNTLIGKDSGKTLWFRVLDGDTPVEELYIYINKYDFFFLHAVDGRLNHLMEIPKNAKTITAKAPGYKDLATPIPANLMKDPAVKNIIIYFHMDSGEAVFMPSVDIEVHEFGGYSWYVMRNFKDYQGAKNIDGEIVIPFDKQFEDIRFSANYFIVTKNGRQGLYSLSGEEVVAPEGIGELVCRDDEFVFINEKDEIVKRTGIKSGIIKESKSSATAIFSNVSLEHNVPNNGRKMLKASYKLEVKNNIGHDVKTYLKIYTSPGKVHNNPEGNAVQASCDLGKCEWKTTYWNSSWMGIYNDFLYARPGTNTYYARLSAWDVQDKKWIGNSDYISFTATGSEQQKDAPAANKSGNSANNNSGVYIPYPSSSGSYLDNSSYDSHSHDSYTRERCPGCGGDGKCRGYDTGYLGMKFYCGGTGRCYNCHGTGHYTNPYTGQDDICNMCSFGRCAKCGGTGTCPLCFGTGYK